MVQFTDNAIQSLFGNEAAENESIARLRQYYVKSDPFEMMTGEAPLRILVGHKGIGKSALVKVALAEAAERGEVAILVRPDDIHGVAAKDADIPELIREWKDGLTTIIAKKVVEWHRRKFREGGNHGWCRAGYGGNCIVNIAEEFQDVARPGTEGNLRIGS